MKNNSKRVVVLTVVLLSFVLALSVLTSLYIVKDYIGIKTKNVWSASNKNQYRIPGIVCTNKGTLIAFCEKRDSLDDWANIDIVCKRSENDGNNWSDEIVLAEGIKNNKTVNNPVMIVDEETIHLIYEIEYGLSEKDGGIYYCCSKDDGCTWSNPIQILQELNSEYNVVGTNQGHSIITSSGRLIVPIWMVRKDAGAELESHSPSVVATIYSDDHGMTWRLGEVIESGDVLTPNESSIVELKDGSYLMNIRNKVDYGFNYTKDANGKINQQEKDEWDSKKYRAISRSMSGIDGWHVMKYDYNLPDPACFGSMVTLDGNDILFVNCNSQKKRENLTVKNSKDNGNTWSKGFLLSEQGGYADIATNGDEIYVLAEQPYIKDNKTYFNLDLYKFNKNNLK